MLFNSPEYVVFLAAVLLGCWLLPHRGQNRLLLVASYVFYGWWDVRFLLLIVIATVVNFFGARMIEQGRLTPGERRAGALWLLAAAFGCVTVRWSALRWDGWVPHADAGALVGSGFGWAVLGAVAAAVALGYALHDRVAALPEARRRRLLVLGPVLVNLGILATFKYLGFFVESAEELARWLGLRPEGLRLDLVLPVGISFFTFQSLSYTLDVERGHLRSSGSLADFALFVAFFPQLVAGPIERATNLLPQIEEPRRFSRREAGRGLHLILLGLFKKVAIADAVAPVVESVFATSDAGFGEIVGGTLLFAVQIYCDFAGYSDIARGSAKLFGIELMTNFRFPYFAKNAREFWRRWHISLSTWLRDYLYISLGGNRHGRTYRNLMWTMVLGGLWHGAAWNFVLWGFFHGTMLCLHRLWQPFWQARRPGAAEGGPLAMAGWFALTCYGWLLFRAESLAQVTAFTGRLVTDFGNLAFRFEGPDFGAWIGIPLLLCLETWEYRRDDVHAYRSLAAPVRGALYAVLIALVIHGTGNAPAEFIYFAF